MQSGIVVLSFLLVASVSDAAIQNVFNFQIPNRMQKKAKFSSVINNLLNRYHGTQNGKQKGDIIDILMNGGNRKQRVNNFIFKDCGGFAGKITKVELYPDPLFFPGDISVSASAILNETLNSPLKAVLSVWWNNVTLCDDASCVYDDVCALLETVSCPDPLVQYGIPCKCPFEKNTYNLPVTVFSVDTGTVEVPSGQYHINAAVYSGGKKAVCADVYATVG